MTVLWRACDFDMSMQIWGYELAGNATEPAAITAENPDLTRWDQDQAYLDRLDRWHGGQRLPTPPWWALPYVIDQQIAVAS